MALRVAGLKLLAGDSAKRKLEEIGYHIPRSGTSRARSREPSCDPNPRAFPGISGLPTTAPFPGQRPGGGNRVGGREGVDRGEVGHQVRLFILFDGSPAPRSLRF